MLLVDLVAVLGQQINVQDLVLQSNGTAALVLNERIEITIEQSGDGDACLIYAYLDRIPEVNKADVHRQMLEVNLFGLETSGATLCLDEQSERVVVYRHLPLNDMSEQVFVDAWTRLVGVALRWSERIMSPQASGEVLSSERPTEWLGV